MSTIQSQRELLKNQKESKKKKTILTIVALVLVVAIVLALVYFLPKKRVEGFSTGNPDAPVKVDQFSNYNCIHCINFANEQEADFIKNYIDTGKVYWTYHNYQFVEDDSSPAAEATYCAAEQNAMWQYKKLLFTYSTYTGAFAEANLIDYAGQLDLDTDKFSACLQSDANLAKLDEIMSYANSLGIDSTPQFSVNGTIVYMDTLDETVDAALLR